LLANTVRVDQLTGSPQFLCAERLRGWCRALHGQHLDGVIFGVARLDGDGRLVVKDRLAW
jgi:hypothetical protein